MATVDTFFEDRDPKKDFTDIEQEPNWWDKANGWCAWAFGGVWLNIKGFVMPVFAAIRFIPTAISLVGYAVVIYAACYTCGLRINANPMRGMDPHMQEYINNVVVYCSGVVPWDTSTTCEMSVEQQGGFAAGYFPLLQSIGTQITERKRSEDQANANAQRAGLEVSQR